MKKKLLVLVFCFTLIFTQIIQSYSLMPPSPGSTPDTGKAYNNHTDPLQGDIIVNDDKYFVVNFADNDIKNGVLVFGRTYMLVDDYIKSGANESTGITDIIGFKVISSDSNYDKACDFNMDNSINIFDILIAAKHFNQSYNNYPSL